MSVLKASGSGASALTQWNSGRSLRYDRGCDIEKLFSQSIFFTSEFFTGGGGGGVLNLFRVWGGGTKNSPTGDTFDQLPGEMSQIRGKIAYNIGDYLVSSPKGAVMVSSPGTESLNPRPHSLNESSVEGLQRRYLTLYCTLKMTSFQICLL